MSEIVQDRETFRIVAAPIMCSLQRPITYPNAPSHGPQLNFAHKFDWLSH